VRKKNLTGLPHIVAVNGYVGKERCGSSGISFSLSAIRPNSGKEWTFIFGIALLQWTFTVVSAMPKSPARSRVLGDTHLWVFFGIFRVSVIWRNRPYRSPFASDFPSWPLSACAAVPRGQSSRQTEGHSGSIGMAEYSEKLHFTGPNHAALTHTSVNFLANKYGQ
jgi:hypothetical protein